MHYQVAYDAANSLPAGWWAPLMGPLLFSAGYFVIRPVSERLRIWQTIETPRRRIYWGLILVAMMIWTVGTSRSIVMNYSAIRAAVRTGNFKTAEGRVTRFVPAPYEGTKTRASASTQFASNTLTMKSPAGSIQRRPTAVRCETVSPCELLTSETKSSS
jgi:hypothetical protein